MAGSEFQPLGVIGMDTRVGESAGSISIQFDSEEVIIDTLFKNNYVYPSKNIKNNNNKLYFDYLFFLLNFD